jgi:hypothetical protein
MFLECNIMTLSSHWYENVTEALRMQISHNGLLEFFADYYTPYTHPR